MDSLKAKHNAFNLHTDDPLYSYLSFRVIRQVDDFIFNHSQVLAVTEVSYINVKTHVGNKILEHQENMSL